MRDPKERLGDILGAIAAIQRYGDRDKANYERDELLQAWFVRNLQIIGEAARGLSEATQALAPSIPWPKIIGMRNVLVHGYFDIDTALVWATVKNDLPILKVAIERMLQDLDQKLGGSGEISNPRVKKTKHTRPKKPRRE